MNNDINHNHSDITDIRTSKDFVTNGLTFSMYKKTKVIQELLQSIINHKIENSLYWSSELICSGYFTELWETIILYLSKYIHLGNPKLPIYIEKRFNQFKSIVNNNYLDNEIDMRNNHTIRTIFAQIIIILCLSKNKNKYQQVNINYIEDFDYSSLTLKLKSPNIEYAKPILSPNDPQDLLMFINEFCFHISETSKNSSMAFYWIEWILVYDKLCKSNNNKNNCLSVVRDFVKVQDKYKNDIIWIIWDAIFHECKKRNNNILSKILHSLLTIYSIKFTSLNKKKRRYVLYFAVSLLTDPTDYSIEIIDNKNKETIDIIINKINLIYNDIKKNQITDKNIDIYQNNITNVKSS